MREIKFQVWDKRRKKMRDWEFVKITYMMLEIENSEYFIWMQSTGFKLKRNEELYKDDIVKIKINNYFSNGSFSTDGGTFIGKVVYSDYAFMIKLKNSTFIFLYELLDDAIEKIEKIGNIHENSELWEK